ncbi:MAG TPA: helix-turn-helix domain-containing protein, partial [Leptospiraceae bacterium]|nr:helix-turn-helix domain-containing protein [Leptospiraceae bacterium]
VESDSSIVDGSLPKLPAQATARKLEKAQAIPDLAHLTPLENAERRTIYEHLVANNFNQRKTSEEIGIRPNTLIAKMRKYEIAPPGGARPGRPRLNR